MLNGQVVEVCYCSIESGEKVVLVLDCKRKVMVVSVQNKIPVSVSYEAVCEEMTHLYVQLTLNDRHTQVISYQAHHNK
jgi:hypothetical protein